MPGEDLTTFLENIGPKGRLMGLDVGDATIGLALSDERRVIASGMETIRRKKFSVDAEALKKIIGEHGVKGLVIGLPLMPDGKEGERCQSTRQFGRNLQKLFEIPIYYQDERFSTGIVEDVLKSAEMSHRKRAEVVDKMAAAYILQGLLDQVEKRKPVA